MVYRDSRREAGDLLDIGLLHLAQKLSRIGRKRFDITALPFGKNSIKCQRRLPRAREAGEYDHLISRERQRNVFEIVGLCPFYGDFVFHLFIVPTSIARGLLRGVPYDTCIIAYLSNPWYCGAGNAPGGLSGKKRTR